MTSRRRKAFRKLLAAQREIEKALDLVICGRDAVSTIYKASEFLTGTTSGAIYTLRDSVSS